MKKKSFYTTAKKFFESKIARINGMITHEEEQYIMNEYVSWMGKVPVDPYNILPMDTLNQEYGQKQLCTTIQSFFTKKEEGSAYNTVILNINVLKQAIALMENKENTKVLLSVATWNGGNMLPVLIENIEKTEKVVIAPCKKY